MTVLHLYLIFLYIVHLWNCAFICPPHFWTIQSVKSCPSSKQTSDPSNFKECGTNHAEVFSTHVVRQRSENMLAIALLPSSN